MSKIYDIRHIGKDHLRGDIHLHLQSDNGVVTVVLYSGGVRKSVKEEELTEQVRSLAKPWGDRPAVIELAEAVGTIDPELEADMKKADEARSTSRVASRLVESVSRRKREGSSENK